MVNESGQTGIKKSESRKGQGSFHVERVNQRQPQDNGIFLTHVDNLQALCPSLIAPTSFLCFLMSDLCTSFQKPEGSCNLIHMETVQQKNKQKSMMIGEEQNS